jgi:hypothetical protein
MKPEAPWRAVGAHTKVAKLIASNIEHTSDDDLKAVIEDVKRRLAFTVRAERSHGLFRLKPGDVGETILCSEAFSPQIIPPRSCDRAGLALRHFTIDKIWPFLVSAHRRAARIVTVEEIADRRDYRPIRRRSTAVLGLR